MPAKGKAKPHAIDVPAEACGECRPPSSPPTPGGSVADPLRAKLIARNVWKWANNEPLRYKFFDDVWEWKGTPGDRAAVKRAFDTWTSAGAGLNVVDVTGTSETAQIKIGFDDRTGSSTWSKVGKQAVEQAKGPYQLTMNFNVPLTGEQGPYLALHEVGHALGFVHEHQNARHGIVWNETAVLDYFKAKGWPPPRIFTDVLEKWTGSEFGGWEWDPESIMNYSFPAGLIEKPKKYAKGLTITARLSAGDKERLRRFYPPSASARLTSLLPFESRRLDLRADEQADFEFIPPVSRKYQIRTMGVIDAALSVFEELDGEQRFLDGDDNSGDQDHASVVARLFAGRRYIVRIRMNFAETIGDACVVVV